jgi:hypothetical protein
VKAWLALSAIALLACDNRPDPVEKDWFIVQIGPRLFRGDFDRTMDAIYFQASDTALSMAYDTRICGLLGAWKGPVLGGTRHEDGRYTPKGPVYQIRSPALLWTIRNGGDTLPSTVRWLGHSGDSTGYVQFRYALILPSGDSIKVAEEPSWDNHYGDNALQRDYRFTGIPPGATVSLRLGATPGEWKELWSHSADGEMIGTGLDRRLEMSADGVANVKVLWEGSASP